MGFLLRGRRGGKEIREGGKGKGRGGKEGGGLREGSGGRPSTFAPLHQEKIP